MPGASGADERSSNICICTFEIPSKKHKQKKKKKKKKNFNSVYTIHTEEKLFRGNALLLGLVERPGSTKWRVRHPPFLYEEYERIKSFCVNCSN